MGVIDFYAKPRWVVSGVIQTQYQGHWSERGVREQVEAWTAAEASTAVLASYQECEVARWHSTPSVTPERKP